MCIKGRALPWAMENIGLSARIIWVLTHSPLNRLYNHGRVGMAGMPYPPTDCRSYIKINMTYLTENELKFKYSLKIINNEQLVKK